MKAKLNDAPWGLLLWLVLLFVPGYAWGQFGEGEPRFRISVICLGPLLWKGVDYPHVSMETRRRNGHVGILQGFFSKRSRGEEEWRRDKRFNIRGTAHVSAEEPTEWDTTYRATVWDGSGNSPNGLIETHECTTPPEPEPPEPPPEPEPPSPPPEPEPPSPPPETPEPEPDTPEPEACPADPACDHIAIVPSMPRAMSGNEDTRDHWLRITNPHGENITVSVTGRDERGTESNTYRRELPAYRSVKVKMRDIEAAFDATNPEGWWALTVTASGTVHVVPMMRHNDTRIVLPVARPGSCPEPGSVTRSR